MKISKEDVIGTAELAQLEFSSEEVEKFTEQLGNIIEHIEDLNELDTKDIKPTSYGLEVSTPLREDIVNQTITVEEALLNAPQSEDGFFVVPKVIED